VLVSTERDLVKAFGAVMDGVHRGEGGKQGLGGADVAGSTVATNVLFASLEGKAVGGSASRVFGHTDQPTRKKTLVGEPSCKVGGVGSTEANRNTETLGATYGDVGSELARRGKEKESQWIGN
jgi:hypothetical protein